MFKLDIVKPTGMYNQMEVEALTLPSTDGQVTILPNHMPAVIALDFGIGKIKTYDGSKRYAISNGMFTFEDNKGMLFLDSIEAEDEIDFMRARAAKERAEARIRKEESREELLRGEFALKRSLIRLSLEKWLISLKKWVQLELLPLVLSQLF